jgi:hypothetical protein
VQRIAGLALIASLHAAASSAQAPSFVRRDLAAAGGPRTVASADFNRDGWPDLALGGTGDSMAILLNRGAGGGFRLSADIFVGGGPLEATTGDVNRDGTPDIVIAGTAAETIAVLTGRGDGTFAPARPLHAPGSPRAVTIADLNRDGRPDLLYTAFTQSAWRVAHGDGAGGFEGPLSYATGPHPQGIVAADLNHDGSTDVAVAGADGELSIHYLLRAHPQQRREVHAPLTVPWNVLTAGDFNQDGWIDLAAASTSDGRVVFLRGGAGGFTPYSGVPPQSSPHSIETGDLNQDGWLDLVLGNRANDTVAVLSGRPDASGLFDELLVPAGRGSRDVALADFNNDGLIDIATANEFAGSATILENHTVPAGRRALTKTIGSLTGEPDVPHIRMRRTCLRVLGRYHGRADRSVLEGRLPVFARAARDCRCRFQSRRRTRPRACRHGQGLGGHPAQQPGRRPHVHARARHRARRRPLRARGRRSEP